MGVAEAYREKQGDVRQNVQQVIAEPDPIISNQWYHLYIVKDNYDIKFYLNGEDITLGPLNPFTNFINSNNELIFAYVQITTKSNLSKISSLT